MDITVFSLEEKQTQRVNGELEIFSMKEIRIYSSFAFSRFQDLHNPIQQWKDLEPYPRENTEDFL